MGSIPRHPYLVQDTNSMSYSLSESSGTIQMNFDPAYNNSEIIEEQLRQWSVNDHIPFYRSNRQVAIRALMDQEESSNHELERKLFDERRSRELAEANLLYEQIRCQEWGSAYDTCVNQLSSQRGEIELLQAEIAYLKETSLPRKRPVPFQLDALGPKKRQVQVLQRKVSKGRDSIRIKRELEDVCEV